LSAVDERKVSEAGEGSPMTAMNNGHGGNGTLHDLRIVRKDRPGSHPISKHELSGQRFVIAAALAMVIVVAVLTLVFRDWRARYRELAEFGAREVATKVDPIVEQVPPGIVPAAWQQAVADTHAMLVSVTASGILDRRAMEKLQADIAKRIERARPDTAITELTDLWDDMESKTGPLLTRDSDSNRGPRRPRRPALLAPKRRTAK
jgi:hypothetical protein